MTMVTMNSRHWYNGLSKWNKGCCNARTIAEDRFDSPLSDANLGAIYMTREQIAGFMFGLGVGTALGFYLRPQDERGPREDNNMGHRHLPERQVESRTNASYRIGMKKHEPRGDSGHERTSLPMRVNQTPMG